MMLLRRLPAGRAPANRGDEAASDQDGDPSGKDESRKLLTSENHAANIASDSAGVRAVLRFDAARQARSWSTMTIAWYARLQPFLRDIGPHFTITGCRPSTACGSGWSGAALTFLEFNYMILQGYDFLELSRGPAAGCSWRIGPVGQYRQRRSS
jgi:tyrosyl-tRNA synthetase